MNPNDTLYTSLLANSSSHLLWPSATDDVVPGHLTLGASFADHHRPPYRADALGAYHIVDDRGLNHFDQSPHEDWITQGTRHVHTHQLAGQQCPIVIPDSIAHFTREDIMPFFDANPPPPPVPITPHHVQIETPSLPVGSLNTCNSDSELPPWGVFNPLEPGFDIQSILPTLCEGVRHLSCTNGRMAQSLQPSNVTRQCQWQQYEAFRFPTPS
ncbi:hypothetical protein J3R82DRAFT_11556 [Butyriboletus roseoflavus]|nr:hypothetical protein J3R82DRAFT_11556 [Butyriboletus roseoflavus]